MDRGIRIALVVALVTVWPAGCEGAGEDPFGGSGGARALQPIDLSRVSLLPAISVAPMPMAVGQAFVRDESLRPSEGKSLSAGTASRGYLVGGHPLPQDHPSLKVRPVSIQRKAIHGTHQLIAGLIQAAESVARDFPGSLLYAGDISAEHGGDIPHHASHNSGRDADLVFFMRDSRGAMADGPDMKVFDRQGRTRDGERFDGPRNWALIAALLKNPSVQIQWIFVATHLEERMIDHAQSSGADPKLIQRARRTMRQPRDSSPHADHFHIRFYCGLEERLRGCVDRGERHAWIDGYGAQIEEETSRIVALLRGGGAEEKRYVIKRIGQLAQASGARYLEPLVDDPDPTVRVMAVDTIAFLRGERTPPAWAHLTDEDVGE